MSQKEKWFRDLDGCIECGTSERKHQGRGLCINCYARWIRKQNPEKYREKDRKINKSEKRRKYLEKYSAIEEHKQDVRDRMTKYRTTHKEICLERTQKWRDGNPDKIKTYNDSRKDYKTVQKYGQDALKKMVECNHACQKCGSMKRVAIHHIDWNPENNTYDNFAVLCAKCHAKLHFWIPERLRRDIFNEWMSIPLEQMDGERRVRSRR